MADMEQSTSVELPFTDSLDLEHWYYAVYVNVLKEFPT